MRPASNDRRRWRTSSRSCTTTSASDRPNHGCLEGLGRARRAVAQRGAHGAGEQAPTRIRARAGNSSPTRSSVRSTPKKKPSCSSCGAAYTRKKKRALIDTTRHVVIESAHPSPLSAHNGFFGSGRSRGRTWRSSRPAATRSTGFSLTASCAGPPHSCATTCFARVLVVRCTVRDLRARPSGWRPNTAPLRKKMTNSSRYASSPIPVTVVNSWPRCGRCRGTSWRHR